jgi:ABC-type multidrug transport system ATPase subunit
MDLRAVAVAALLTSLALGAAAQGVYSTTTAGAGAPAALSPHAAPLGPSGPAVACPEGFYGVNCALCQTDAGCAAAGAPGATCSAVFSYSAASERKSYGCELEDDGFLSELVVPGSVAVSCATGAAGTAPAPAGGGGGGAAAPAPAPGLAAAPGPAGAPALAAPPPPPLSGFNAIVDSLQQFVGRRLLADPAAPVAAGATCEYAFTVKDGGMRVACAATQCALPAGALGATCAATKCACPDSANCGGGLVASLAGGVSGASSFTCSAAGACQLKMTGLPIQQLAMTCTAAECLAAGAGESGADGQPGDGGGGGGAAAEEESTASGALTPALAAIPAMLLLLACGAAGAYVWANRALWGCPPEEAAAAAKALGAGGAPVGRLEFRSLSVALALGARARARKAAALRATALARGASRPRDAAAPDASAEFGAGGGPAAPAPPPPNPLGSALARLRRRPRAPAPPPAAPPAEDEDEAAAAAADFVAGLHAGGAPGEWAVLAGVSGAARGGEVVGLLGPSGCGKTTLLSALAGSAPDLGAAARVRGAVLVDGAPRRAADVAYVPQADHLIPTLTVQECLRYSALLRLPRGAPPGEVQARVDAALAELGLRHVADAAVGGSGGVRGVSGGERRRVTIGMELVTDPRILVLDEPTSGLDSFSALSLLRALRAVAARGRVVVASLHQPSADMFYALDRVMLMAHGHVLYAGRPGDAAAALAAAGCPVPEGAAVAEHLLQVASSPADLRRMLAAAPAAAAPGSPGEVAPLGAPPAAALDALEGGGPDDAGALTSAATAPPRPQGAARQLAVMFWRTLVDVVRNPALLALHAGVALAMGVVFGLIFWQLDDDSVGVQNRMGGTFFALAFLAFTSLTTVDLLMNERLVVHREVGAAAQLNRREYDRRERQQSSQASLSPPSAPHRPRRCAAATTRPRPTSRPSSRSTASSSACSPRSSTGRPSTTWPASWARPRPRRPTRSRSSPSTARSARSRSPSRRGARPRGARRSS